MRITKSLTRRGINAIPFHATRGKDALTEAQVTAAIEQFDLRTATMTVVSTPFACENLKSKGYRSVIDVVTGSIIQHEQFRGQVTLSDDPYDHGHITMIMDPDQYGQYAERINDVLHNMDNLLDPIYSQIHQAYIRGDLSSNYWIAGNQMREIAGRKAT